jgi:hypothetical protein
VLAQRYMRIPAVHPTAQTSVALLALTAARLAAAGRVGVVGANAHHIGSLHRGHKALL